MTTSTYAANALLNLLFRGVAFTAPARVYVSLHTADPGANGANEVSTGAWPAYARQDPAQGAAVASGFDAAASKATQNAKQMLFPANNGAGAVTITHFGIWDAATGGNFLHGDALTASKSYAVADEPVVNIGALDISVS